MSSVEDPWTEDADIRAYTDTDLDETRTKNTKVSDTSRELHRLTESLARSVSLDSYSDVLDRALRVEVAATIDSGVVTIDRDQYDVGVMIPPRGWVRSQNFDVVGLVDGGELDVEGRWLGFSTTPTVWEMAQSIVSEGVYGSVSELVGAGVRRLLGQ